MSRFLSDIQKNKDIVADSFRKQESFFELMDSANKIVEEAIQMSESSTGRHTVYQFIADNVYEMAIWKATNSLVSWVSFQNTLKNNRVTARDQANIRQIINAQFEEFLSDVSYDYEGEEKYIEIEVKCIVSITKGGRGLKIKYEGLD